MSILALLNRPLSSLAAALTSLAGAVTSFDRIQDYLNVDEKQDKRIWTRPATAQSVDERSGATAGQPHQTVARHVEDDSDSDSSELTYVEEPCLPNGISVTVDGKLTWPGSKKPVLDIRELSIPSSMVTLLLGPTGCGKTTLLNAILGELMPFEGSIRITTVTTSYCAQKSWLPSSTIRKAIIGNVDYDEDWYARTISACALLPDLAALPEGDRSLLGNKGTMLSGGQKQRIVSLISNLPTNPPLSAINSLLGHRKGHICKTTAMYL